MKTYSVRLKRPDQYQSDNRETGDKTKPVYFRVVRDCKKNQEIKDPRK